MNHDSRSIHRPFWPLLNELIPLQRLKRMTENYARLTGLHVGVLNARGEWLVPVESSCLRAACVECKQFYTSQVRHAPSKMKQVCSDCNLQRFGVPVLVRQHSFGVLVTEPTKVDPQSIPSIHASHSYEELKATGEDLSREVSAELTRRQADRISGLLLGNASSLQETEYCGLIVSVVREILGCDYAAIIIRDEMAPDGLPKLAATSGAENESMATWTDLQRLAVKCLEHGEAIDVKDALDDPCEPRQLALAFALPFARLNVRSIAALPVTGPNGITPFAVIMAAAKQPQSFDEQDWRTLREIVRLTALNTPTAERTSGGLHRKESLQLLTSFTNRVTELHSSDDTLDALLGAVVEATDSQVGEIVVTQPDNPQFVKIRAAYGSLHDHTGHFSPANAGVHGRVIRTGVRIVSINLQKEPGFQDLQSGLGSDADRDYRSVLAKLRSGICLPIQAIDNVSGVLCLARLETKPYGKRHIQVAEYSADRISRVLEDEKKNNLLAAKVTAEHDLLELTKQPMKKVEHCNQVLQALYEQLVTAATAFPGVKYASVREYSQTTDHIRYLHVNNPDIWPKDMQSRSWRRDSSGGRFAARTGRLHRFGSSESAKKAVADGRYVVAFPEVESHVSIPLRVAGLATLIWTLESPRQNLFEGQTLAGLEELARDAETVLNWLGQTRELLSVGSLENVCAISKDITELAESAANVLQDAFDAKTCAIYLQDPSRNGIECVGVSRLGLDADPSRERATWYSLVRDADERSLTSHVARMGQTLRIDNLTCRDSFSQELWGLHQHAAEKWPEPQPSQPSLLVVPLKGRIRDLGVIRLAGREQSGQPFTVEEQNQAERFAKRLSFAFEQLFFQQRKRIADRFAQLPVRTDAKLTAEDVAEAVCTVMGSPTVEVRLLSGKFLRLTATAGNQMEVQPDLIRIDTGLCGSSIKEEPQVVVIRDTQDDHRWESCKRLSTDTWSPSVRSVIVAPLQLDATSKPIGTLSVYSYQPVRFGPADLPVIDEMVRQASQLIIDARQHEPRFRLLEAIRIASVQAVYEQETVSMGASAADIAKAFVQLIPEACATVWLLNDAKTHLVCREVSNVPDAKSIEGFSAVLRDDLIRALLDETKPPRWIPEINDIPELRDMTNRLNSAVDRRWIRSIKAAGIAPISLAGGLAGAIFCYLTHDRFDLLSDNRAKEIQEDFTKLADHVKLVFGTIQLLERTRKELELTAPLAMIGALLDSILHHLVQPLHNMRVTMPNARRLAVGHSQLFPKLESIGNEIDRMEQNIVDLKAIVTGRNVRTAQKFDVASTVRKIAERACLEWPGIEVATNIPDEPVHLAGIEPVLEAGVRMVVQNAAEAIETNPEFDTDRRLTISLRRADGDFIVTITDTGSGMNEAVLRASQQPGFTTKAKGSGMGLTVAHAACNWHGGHLQIASELNRGTTVDFHIPDGR